MELVKYPSYLLCTPSRRRDWNREIGRNNSETAEVVLLLAEYFLLPVTPGTMFRTVLAPSTFPKCGVYALISSLTDAFISVAAEAGGISRCKNYLQHRTCSSLVKNEVLLHNIPHQTELL